MGIDHGLGGRDGVKSKQKREKKAKKTRVIAMKALTGGKKKEVIFDEQARTEWLSGFHKRKQERRKYGLAMEVLKKAKAHKDMLKEHRNIMKDEREEKIKAKSRNVETMNDEDNEEDEEVEDPAARYSKELLNSSKNKEVSVYEDASTVSMFGSTVSVVVDDGMGGEDGEDSDADTGGGRTAGGRRNSSNSIHNGNTGKKELSRLEKALRVAKSQMGQKKKKHRDNSIQGKAKSKAIKGKVESSKLLNKALGKNTKTKKQTGARPRR
jgi:hypothetical protein